MEISFFDLKAMTFDVVKLAKEVANFISSAEQEVAEESIQVKEFNSLVTYVDQQAEQQIVKRLEEIFPRAGFLTEEETENVTKGEYTWVVDPLDGTTNFLHKLPFYSISISLKRNNDYIIGVVHEIPMNRTFYAWENGGAFEDGKQIFVSKTPILQESLIATGFPYAQFDQMEEYLSLFKALFPKCRGLRRIGSCALDMAYVARGSFDAFFEYGLNEWDMAGGVCLVREAGGTVSSFLGTENFLGENTLLVTNTTIHTEMQSLVEAHFRL